MRHDESLVYCLWLSLIRKDGLVVGRTWNAGLGWNECHSYRTGETTRSSEASVAWFEAFCECVNQLDR